MRLAPGPMMDAAIARRLWRAIVFMDIEGQGAYLVRQGDHARMPLPGYSTNVDDAHRVVKQMQAHGYAATLKSAPEFGKCYACFTQNDGKNYRMSEAETLPMAICLAAVEALDGTNLSP